jgi:cation transport ATPase
MFWFVIGALLLLLGLNKQLDLQTMFEANMKELALTHGWYAQRHLMQLAFIGALAMGLLTMLFLLRRFLAKSWRNNKIVCFGLFLIAVFIVLRAAAFNHFSFLNTRTYLGFNAHALLEIGALGIIFYGTYVGKPTVSMDAVCSAEGDDVYCPQCNTLAVSKAVDGRQFKCKACAAIYTVHIS